MRRYAKLILLLLGTLAAMSGGDAEASMWAWVWASPNPYTYYDVISVQAGANGYNEYCTGLTSHCDANYSYALLDGPGGQVAYTEGPGWSGTYVSGDDGWTAWQNPLRSATYHADMGIYWYDYDYDWGWWDWTEASDTANPFVPIPTSVSVVSGAYTDSPPSPYAFHRVYQILDQNGNPIPGNIPGGLQVTEDYSPNPPTGSCGIGAVTGGGFYADASGQFPDDYYMEGGGPGCFSTSTQTYYVNGRLVRQQNVTWEYTGVTID